MCGAESMGAVSLGTESEVGLVFLELHHEVMNIDELGPGWQRPELRLPQHPVEAMVELDQLGQRPLHRDDRGQSFTGISDTAGR